MGHLNKCILFCVLIVFISCQKKAETKNIDVETNHISISLEKKLKNSPFSKIMRPLSFVEPGSKELIGLPELDTFLIQFFTTTRKSEILKLYKNGSIDSIKKPFKNLKRGVFAVNGYQGDKQIIIIDANNNNDFSDDRVFEFEKEFKYNIKDNPKLKDSLPTLNIQYEFFDGKDIDIKEMIIKPLPYYKFLHGRQDNLKDELQIVTEIKEYFIGQFNISGEEYKIAVNEQALFGTQILIRPVEEEFFKSTNPDFFAYRIKDTINISDRYYRLDSINPGFTFVSLIDLNLKTKDYGYRKNEKIKNFSYTNLDGIEKKISTLLKRKEYVLLDFWGTWCAPCKELTPDLVEMNSTYTKELNILSVAFDKDKEPVIEYTEDHSMKWNHHYVEGDAKKSGIKPGIINDLKIESYPTFILIDKKFNIVYRGNGKKALEEIKAILPVQQIKK